MVDDDTVFREELTRLLDEDGHQVVNSPSVVKAIAELEARDVDVLLTDLKMPRQGGLELLKEVRHRWPRTLVIVLTGFATVETAVESMKQGAFDYVRKPFEIKEIQRVLDAAARELRYAEEGSPGVDPASLIRKWVSADHREVLLITDRPVPSRDGVTVLRPDFSNPYRIREDVDGFVDARTRRRGGRGERRSPLRDAPTGGHRRDRKGRPREGRRQGAVAPDVRPGAIVRRRRARAESGGVRPEHPRNPRVASEPPPSCRPAPCRPRPLHVRRGDGRSGP